MSGLAEDNERPARLDIQRSAARYGAALDELAAAVGEVEAVQRAAVRERLDVLQALASRAGEQREILLGLVREHPHLFEGPRSFTVAGVKVGWRKKPGRITPGKSTIALIKAKLADKAHDLIRLAESVDLHALKLLSVRELALVGAKLTHSTDAPFVEPARSDVERLAASLLRDATAEDGA